MTLVKNDTLCNEKVFESTYKMYSQDLFRFLTYSFKNRSLSEDVTQNVFLKLWDQCHRFELSNIKSLIFTMGKNLSLNELKKNKKNQGNESKEIFYSESPQDVLEEKQFKENLNNAINKLSSNERIVFLMSRMDNLTYREIAERLNISQKAVEKRMHQALKKLNDLLSIDLKRK
ncbi:MAG: RNA polymerase sigma factor [Flavobacteriales bacterium]|jgi:RNA polymerase sigma-70 factor (family 1)|tara:strand:- start:3656 stop:4177 length:522 start_codon:yes stop_codon:yes gene_type:complete